MITVSLQVATMTYAGGLAVDAGAIRGLLGGHLLDHRLLPNASAIRLRKNGIHCNDSKCREVFLVVGGFVCNVATQACNVTVRY